MLFASVATTLIELRIDGGTSEKRAIHRRHSGDAGRLVWAAQGSGYFPYPASSFMINETKWIYIGLATAVAGVALIVLSWSR